MGLAMGHHGDKIFISYRRDDTQGYAGRLEDSLAAYFGPDRVFRDVGGIETGVDFAHAVETELGGAGAVIALIGPSWLTATRDGRSRLEDENDYVSIELVTALERGMPVLPVLVEDTYMPREDELPEALKPLARRNALSLSDERWSVDVTRLAKVIAIDVPGSIAERKLSRLVGFAILLLLVTLVASVWAFTWAAYASVRSGDQAEPRVFRVTKEEVFPEGAFSSSVPSAGFVAISAACLLLMLAVKHVDRARRRTFQLSIGAGLIGMLSAFAFYGLVNAPADVLFLFPFIAITIGVMLVLLVRTAFEAT